MIHSRLLGAATLAALLPSLPAYAEFTENDSLDVVAAPPPDAPSMVIQDSIVITAPRRLDAAKAEQAATPGAVTLVDGEELFLRNTTTLADMLRYVPGVWTADGATGDSAFFSSRGSNLDSVAYDGNGVRFLQDGLPVTAADGNNHNREVDPLSASHAVVAHGANALTYGASTLGGAIDYITPTARDRADPEIVLNGGSFGQQQARISAGQVSGRFDALISAEIRRWDGYRDQQHEQQREGLYANAGWQFSEALGNRTYLSYIHNDQELPGSLTREQWRQDPEQANAANVAGNHQFDVETWRIANKTQWDLSPDRRFSAGFSFEEQLLYHPIVFSPFFSLLIDTEQRNAGSALRYQIKLGKHDVLAGINYGRTWVKGGNYSHDGQRKTSLQTLVDNDAENTEVFLVDRWQFAQRWTAVYGAQVVSGDRHVRNTSVASGAVRDPRGSYDSVNPRLGLIHQWTPEVTLFTNLSRLYEAPTLYELEDDVRGNGETLEAMTGTVLEIGTRGAQAFGEASHWRWDLALYYAALEDEILSMEDPAAPGTSLSANIDDTVHAGLEAVVGASFAVDTASQHRVEPLLSLTLNHFRFDDDPVYGSKDLPAAPRHVIRGEILYRHAKGFFAGPTFDIVGRRYADFSNTYTVGAYELLGLRTGVDRGQWSVFAELRNLTDEEYISMFSVRDTAAEDAAILTPGAPLSAYVGTRFRF